MMQNSFRFAKPSQRVSYTDESLPLDQLGTTSALFSIEASSELKNRLPPRNTMKYTQKIKSLFAGVLAATLLTIGVSNSSAVNIGDSGSGTTGKGIWQAGTGGEFYFLPTSGTVTNGSYSPLTRDQGVSGSFQTFCLEERLSLVSPVSYVVNDEAVSGGPNFSPPPGSDGGDILSQATSWLYSQFAQGLLAGYDYSNSVSRKASALALQEAIWYFEHEILLTAVQQAANVYIGLGNAHGGFANSTPGQNGVYALNLSNSTTRDGQDVLYFDDGRRVPDGGASIMLLGIALGGVGLARRFLIKKA